MACGIMMSKGLVTLRNVRERGGGAVPKGP